MNKKRTYSNIFFTFPLLAVLFFYGCKKYDMAEISTTEITGKTQNSVTVEATIPDDGGLNISERGICWSTSPAPLISDDTIRAGSGTGLISCSIIKLLNNSPYYVRAYAINKKGVSYGQEVTFTLWLNQPGEPVTDKDGNTYNTVRIGDQVWMKENLKTIQYRNGDPIPNITMQNDAQWLTLTSGAYCDFNDNTENAKLYGHLYNWYAVNDIRNICPVGWHIPESVEWKVLLDYMGGWVTAGSKLKSVSLWEKSVAKTTNESGFSALPGGFRFYGYLSPNTTSSFYYYIGTKGAFWGKDETKSIYYTDWVYSVQFLSETEWAGSDDSWATKKLGLSIRCIKD
jgi:uncharacterized protein (TIGR02145 family)